jgi:hypothetical protein
MSWIETIIAVIVLLGGGLYLLLALAIIVTALIERRSVNFLVPAELNDPEWQSFGEIAVNHGAHELAAVDSKPFAPPGMASYAESQIRSASRLGFTAPRLFKHSKGGIYKTRCVLMVSPSRQILAIVRWGTTASIGNHVTMLFSAFEDGGYIRTSDRSTGGRVPELIDDVLMMDADFDDLFHRQEERLRASGQNIRQLSAEGPLAEYHAILECQARFLVAKGDAYWVNPEQTEYRSTPSGALKLYTQTLSTSHVDRTLVGTKSR